MSINTIAEVAETLEKLGYEVKLSDSAVMTKVGGADMPFPTVITRNDADGLVITCRLALLKDVKELDKFMITALDANTRTLPYAIGLLTGSDNPELDNEEEWPVVLINSLSMADLSEAEVEDAMDSLLHAILTCSNELKELLS